MSVLKYLHVGWEKEEKRRAVEPSSNRKSPKFYRQFLAILKAYRKRILIIRVVLQVPLPYYMVLYLVSAMTQQGQKQKTELRTSNRTSYRTSCTALAPYENRKSHVS